MGSPDGSNLDQSSLDFVGTILGRFAHDETDELKDEDFDDHPINYHDLAMAAMAVAHGLMEFGADAAGIPRGELLSRVMLDINARLGDTN